MPKNNHHFRGFAFFLGLLLLLVTLAPTQAAPLADSRYFSQTGQTVQGGFLDYFDRYGGVRIFGYPITGEILENGKTVQYFQRARLEWHPNNPAAYRVQLGLVGQELHGPPTAPAPALASGQGRTVRYFGETGHNVTNVFLAFWQGNGGLDIFGYPLGEAYTRDGVTYQWFQRARFEYRNNRVELGLIGQEQRSGTPQNVAAPLPVDNVRRRQFPQTGQTVQGAFLDYFERNGAEIRFGLPLSGEYVENGKTIQYFEYARFEYVPGNAPGSQVQLGLIGSELFPPQPPATNFAPPWNTNYRYFSETGHTVSFAFLRYFDTNGGVTYFGYPISEAYSEGGKTIQWFQRRKLEYYENRVVDVPLGRVRFNPGAEGRFEPQQVFLPFLSDNGSVRARLGAGLGDAANPTIAYQPFEGGQMLWRSDSNEIYVLYNNGAWQVYANPWRQGDPVSAGYSPPAGRVEPVLGLGAVWRSVGGPGSGLGWATAGQAQGTGTAQKFQYGSMLYNPVTNQVYVLYAGAQWYNFDNIYPGFVPPQ